MERDSFAVFANEQWGFVSYLDTTNSLRRVSFDSIALSPTAVTMWRMYPESIETIPIDRVSEIHVIRPKPKGLEGFLIGGSIGFLGGAGIATSLSGDFEVNSPLKAGLGSGVVLGLAGYLSGLMFTENYYYRLSP